MTDLSIGIISFSTSGTHRVNLVKNLLISRELGKDREVFTTSRTYPWPFVTQIFQYAVLISLACNSFIVLCHVPHVALCV
jgi:hypothetical protein